ncbi:E3 SUMO-protein ligase ZNF451 isoform X2 [Xiphias gladius]|uniref:E3 SUMO-protein ligase ZNF451 isoform X2 n=1 Tax=Xiphias gladius TaxID=8245 RepID=UPI001A981B68|nr:E3 SUMO-protein ligase ZNF451 isoform X2 [Xiphias gladius]XP_039995853.1 E3 SUMO-protein ligase ZNF451 isoform X2 [Xiphias gladius]XP_039995854.1 E3 SUMO-protein ligase ZNF451 isoform X2 [Xiphias gladius]XP_039995855.1 E3 SUMO-protein ligase ZNF451 isoform X2 [Xiphias gladius]XP_039995856.1 E3 SUMO-protein ligase ZNF451 isoform X2 [Xiphias gladius]XP_039995857.1 E3 SUMO-protein ligase ZNF451 isoform X2 [Xiphias gladius]
MSSPAQADEDEVEEEVEFVSLEDKITRHKARVTSTLDRLAHQVALEKKERADRCRAFKEKQILQRAHGQQELAFSTANGVNQEAKRCVDMWLKMPGPQPGVIAAGSGRRHRPTSFPRNSLTRHTCPVINCGRVYDNASLLDGHLKRFDHSPCDPAINLKGCPSELFACVACGQHFQTKEAWRKHLETKVSSSTADAHRITQTYQRIVCFACPACYLLFNLRDECLQHMSAKNHFTEALAMNEPRGRALPVPVPQYVKNYFIALCKDTAFNVRCSLCHKVLMSHQTAQAHFNVYCRQGCAVAKADKTIVQVMKQLQVRGQCSLCCKIFLSQAEIERHKESAQHDVEVNQTMEKALLQYCRFGEIQHTQRAKEAQGKRKSTGFETPFQKHQRKSDCEIFPAKRQRHSPIVNGSTSRNSATAWYCECGLQFSEEAAASKHLLAVNQIFHQCGVCGKHMGESSITRLHMSRFHGGAHLSNFLFYCRKCRVEMPRYEDILSHVSEAHSGHTYFTEQEVSEEVATVIDAKPSTSKEVPLHSSSKSIVQQHTVEPSTSKAEQTWMCRMCEDIFDSEAAVHKHCRDVSTHSFQRFICGHCPQKFFKESTVRRHCMNEHNGQIKSSHFCGLCDSMQFESEGEFLEHYKSLHSKDYYCMDDVEVVQPTVAEGTSQLTCPCMGSEKSKEEMKTTYTQCMRSLAAEGKCQYVCTPCCVSMPSYAQMKTHVHTKHAALNLDKTFDVECKACQESFTGVPSFHKHYHSRHCTLEPCMSSRTCKKGMKAEPTTVKILHAVEIKPDKNESEDETRGEVLNIYQASKESEANENGSDEEMKHALSLIEDEARESAELEEALKRSLLEF